MLGIFQRTPVHVKIFRDKIEMINLKTGDSIAKSALQKFSSSRLLVADYSNAEELCRLIAKELRLPRNIKVLIQPMEILEGGLGESEKRTMRDLAEQIGAVSVAIVTDVRSLTNEEALQILKTV